jgi:hypothetical protein
MNKRNMLARIALFTLLLSFACAATAGKFTPLTVTISDADQVARGSVVGARLSQDNVQYIGCSNEGNGLGICLASNAAGVGRNCITDDPRMLDAIDRVGPNSHIRFGWNNDGTCRLVQVYNASMFQQ